MKAQVRKSFVSSSAVEETKNEMNHSFVSDIPDKRRENQRQVDTSEPKKSSKSKKHVSSSGSYLEVPDASSRTQSQNMSPGG